MKLRIMSLILGVVAECLIAVLFFVLIPDQFMTTAVRWLDFIVVSIIAWLWLFNSLTAPIDLDDRSGARVGGIGIRWYSVGVYTTLAVLFMLINIFMAWDGGKAMEFGWQAFIQGILVLMLAGGLLASEFSMKNTSRVYVNEEYTKKGKADVKAELTRLLYAAQDAKDVPAEVRDRINTLVGESRYISPSRSTEALMADDAILEDCRILSPALYSYEMNRQLIDTRLDALERDFRRRRAAY